MRYRRGFLSITFALTAVVAMICTQSPASAASAASSHGWRIVKVFGASYGDPSLSGGTSESSTNSWVVGNTYTPSTSLFLARSNGTAWTQVSVPAKFSDLSGPSLTDGVVAATKTSTWTFPSIYASQTHTYALRLRGGHWTTYRLPHAFQISAAAIFGRSDVWAFGFAVPPKPVLGFGPPYAARFNGHTWRRVAMPGVAESITVLSRRDIWAFGPTAKTAGDFTQVYIAMHWTGHRWRTMSLPRMRAANGKRAFPAGLAVLSGNRLWMTQEFHCPHPGCQPAQPPGMLLARWNGRKWIRVLDISKYDVPSLEPNGHGGLWISALDLRTSSFVYLRYTRGRLVTMSVPGTSAGSSDNVSLPIPIPGTSSAWATADVPVSGSLTAGAVLKLGK